MRGRKEDARKRKVKMHVHANVHVGACLCQPIIFRGRATKKKE